MLKCLMENRRWTLVAVVLIVAGIGFGAGSLRFTSDYKVYFAEDNPELIAFENIQSTYQAQDNVLFVLAPADGTVFDADTIEAVQWLTQRAWQLPFTARVDSVSNFQHSRAARDTLQIGPLVPAGTPPEDLKAAGRTAMQDPRLVNRLISAEGDVTGINVVVQFPGKRPDQELRTVADAARELAAELRQRSPDLDVHLTGIVMMNTAFPEASERDTRLLVPIMFGIVLVTLFVLLRSMAATLAAFSVVVGSVVIAMGATGWAGAPLTPPSVSAPIIILTLAIADSVHILVSYLSGLRHGSPRLQAMHSALGENMAPIVLTTGTTMLGFLTMNLSESPPFRALGNMVAVGAAAALLLSLTLLPALMLMLPVRSHAPLARGYQQMQALGNWVVNHRRLLLVGGLCLSSVVCLGLPLNELDDDFVEYLDEGDPFRTATEFANERLTGIYTLDYSLNAAQPNGMMAPENLRFVDRFVAWYGNQPEVHHVASITDTIKQINADMHGGAEQWYALPETSEGAAQYLLLYELSLPYGLDLNNRLNVDRSATRITVTLDTLSSVEFLALEARAARWLEANAPADFHWTASSPHAMFTHIGQRNIQGMLLGTLLAFTIITAVMIVAFRSVRIGVVTMLPNLFPSLIAFGAWGFLVGRVGLALSVVSAMTLGIVVDNTIHFTARYLRARRDEGLSPANAVVHVFAQAGRALWTTTAVLISAFLVLSQSGFQANSEMGLLTAGVLLVGILFDFLVLPPLLMGIDARWPVTGTADGKPTTTKEGVGNAAV